MANVKTSRQEKAARTRTRMLEAAYRCFCDSGYRGTTMTDIAKQADVAVQTLYFTFHTKDELFQAVHDRTVLGVDELPPPLQPWHAQMVEAKEIATAVHHLVAGVEVIFARVAPMLPAFWAVSADPAGAVWRHGELVRLEGYSDLVAELTATGPLRQGLTRSHATDLLFVLLSPDVYRSLVLERGWSPAQWRTWVEQSILRDLFGR